MTPEAIIPEDITPLRLAGVSDQAIEEAIYVCILFNIIDRIADALGFVISSPESFARQAEVLLKRGYK